MEFQQSNDIVEKIDEMLKIKGRTLFITKLGDLAAVLIQSNYPFIPDIVSQIKELSDGEIHFTLRVKEGKVNTIVTHQFTKHVYK